MLSVYAEDENEDEDEDEKGDGEETGEEKDRSRTIRGSDIYTAQYCTTLYEVSRGQGCPSLTRSIEYSA